MASSSTWSLQSLPRSARASSALHLALLLIWAWQGFSQPSFGSTVSFSIIEWSPESDITLSQNAYYAENGSFVGLLGPGFPRSTPAGAFHTDPVAFVDPCTNRPASFSTSFTFAIQAPGYPDNVAVPGPADGLAFVIAPTLHVSPSSSGGRMGIFSQDFSNGDPAIKTVAVEIDTFQNDYDPAAPHIGLDINSIVSNATEDVSDIVADGPGTPQKVTVWVDYDAPSHGLTVFAAKAPAQKSQAKLLFSYDLNLTSVINPFSYVGFSAASGSGSQHNFVYAWSFKTFFLP